MKLKETTIRYLSLGRVLTAVTLCAALNIQADEAAPAAAPEPEKPFVSGTLNLTVDTHFISYGADTWGAGTKWNDPLFHPSLELNMDLGKGFKGILGTWWDVNNNATTTIGDEKIQEVDVWVGAGYALKDFTFTALYQEWMYAAQSERIVDFKVAHADFLNPSLTIHGRVDNGLDMDNGVAAVLGVAPGTTLGPVSLSFPLNVAAETDGFHGGDSGFSFVSVGVGVGVPLKFLKGNWTLSGGLTYYHTDDNVIPNNPESDFLTGNLGIILAF